MPDFLDFLYFVCEQAKTPAEILQRFLLLVNIEKSWGVII